MSLVAAWLAIALSAAALIYRWRQRVWRLCAVVVSTAVASVLALILTGDVAASLVAAAAKILIATTLLSIVLALLTVRGFPRLGSRRDRGGVALVCAAVAAGYLAVAVFLAIAADDRMRVGELPQLRTRAEFLAQRDAPPRPGGVLMEATLSDRNSLTGEGAVASISCPAIGGRRLIGAAQHLPDRYLLEFPGGPPVIATGIGSSLQTWRWPPEGSGSGDCVLRQAAPVVVWGDVRKRMGGSGSTSQTGLGDTRMIAVGDIATFIRDYGPVARRTAQAVYALAALNAGLGALTIVVGATTWRRLTRYGADGPPRITWR